MRKYLYISFLLLLIACQKEEIISYDQDLDSIQFNFDVEEMEYDYNFATQNIYENWEYYFFGDSLKQDTIVLYISLMGHASDVDRPYKLKAVPIEGFGAGELATVEFLPSYSIKANQLKDTIEIVMIRPEARGNYSVGVTFDVEDGGALFAMGVEERAVYRLNISDRYEQPDEWDKCAVYTGKFSEEKYAFMVTVLHKEWSFYNDWGNDNRILRDELKAFNDRNPDHPKDFTFPVLTRPTWWDERADYLGEFSEEKHAFMDTILPPGYGVWHPWHEFNKLLRDELDAYNQAHPEDPLDFEFPVNTTPIW